MKTMNNNFLEYFNNIVDNEINKVKKQISSKFKIDPVTPQEFFNNWLKMPLFPAQYSIVNHVFTPDYKDFKTDINELMIQWGEGSGKNTACARSLAYIAYWLTCLHNPQEYLNIGKNTPVVLCNVSFREEHASGIFFKQFTTCLKNTINPATGKNWFEEQGMDLREGKDIQTRKVIFPNHIEATSESSIRYTAEGKNILVAVFDEIAEFRYDKAKALYNNLKNTAFSRFPYHYKIISISYPRDPYDFFVQLYNSVDSWEEPDRHKVFRETKASWEVRSSKGAHPLLIEKRIYRTKEDYAPMYRKDPEDAMRRYECKFPKYTANRYLKKFDIVLEKCIKFDRPYPYIAEDDESLAITEEDLLNLVWQPWFKPCYSYKLYQLEQELTKNPSEELKKQISNEQERHENAQYFLHVDLSRGLQDYAGLLLLHTYSKLFSQTGYYVDLAVQIKPAEDEIQFDRIQKFIISLTHKGFDLTRVTFDGFQSTMIIQNLEREGIPSNIISVDRSRKPYDTLKHLLYQGLVDIYYYPPLIRELKELIITEKGKVDHPKESSQRLKEEGIKRGSKDIADCLAATIFSAVEHESDSGPVVLDANDLDIDPDRFIDKYL